jgi:hypothetical protein
MYNSNGLEVVMKRKTKIICTLGPSVDNEVMIGKLIDAGMNVSRLNFSHADHSEHFNRIQMVRKIAKEKGRIVGILADTKGPEIRTGAFENGKVAFQKGDIVKIMKEPVLGTKEAFHIDVPELFEDIKVGQYILIDDGKMRLDVIEKYGNHFVCQLFNSGVIKTKKGVNVPNVKLSMPFLSEKDIKDITFASEAGVDMFALSFVRRKEDVLEVKALLKKIGYEDVEVKLMLLDRTRTVFANYVVGNRTFWQRFMNFSRQLFNEAEKDSEFKHQVFGEGLSNYAHDQSLPNFTFLIERLIPTFLEMEKFKVCPYIYTDETLPEKYRPIIGQIQSLSNLKVLVNQYDSDELYEIWNFYRMELLRTNPSILNLE